MANLCRDESCLVLEDKIESTFGSCFSTHGLGGILTCGVIGIKAGLSHSPVVGVSGPGLLLGRPRCLVAVSMPSMQPPVQSVVMDARLRRVVVACTCRTRCHTHCMTNARAPFACMHARRRAWHWCCCLCVC